MKLLVAVPVVNNPHVTRQCLDSIVHQRIDIVLLSNGQDPEIKELFEEYSVYPSVKHIFWEPENIYVTGAWNKFLKYFLDHSQHTHLGILNSDTIVQHDFFTILNGWYLMYPGIVPIPKEVNKVEIKKRIFGAKIDSARSKIISGGHPGIFILLHRKAAELVNPIPEQIRVWFNDDWIYSLCHAAGYTLNVISDLKIFHEGSQTVNSASGIFEIIDRDKIAWEESVKPLLTKKIKQFFTT